MMNIRVLFVLPSRGANGGSNSVVQECMELDRMGCTVGIVVGEKQLVDFQENYPELRSTRVRLLGYADPKQLGEIFGNYDIAVATIYVSVYDLAAAISSSGSDIKTCYYVQDYEPLFFEVDSPEWERARQSYTLLKNCTLFAKTEWLCWMIHQNHGVSAAKVEPSIDHNIYYPAVDSLRKRLKIVAMLRPHTPRRAPHRTLRVLSRIAAEFSPDVDLCVFGTDARQLELAGIDLPEGVHNLGRLRRTEVPEVLRSADLFIDASDYQAFGRTGLEAMASGCIPVVPVFGGTGEYAINRENALVVDTRFDDEVCSAIFEHIRADRRYRDEMKVNALKTAARYNSGRAAVSEYEVFVKVMRA